MAIEPNFRFREDKAADAAAEIIRLQGGHADMIRVIKLLYLIDRESFAKRNMPITGDRYVSMDNGPVVSTIYDLLKDVNGTSTWHSRIRRQGYTLSVTESQPLGALSDNDRAIIAEVVRRHADKDTWALCDWTHTLPEWRNPRGSSIPISVHRILEELGRNDGEIAAIAEREAGWQELYRAISAE